MSELVHVSGPVFDGRAAIAAEAACREIERHIAEEGASKIRDFLPTQYKYLGHSGGNPNDNPIPRNAGWYESQINAEAQGEHYLITDGGAIYGPWLEGVGGRNQAERFPGYHTFREISQRLDSEATPIAESIMTPYIAAMNV